jgi:alpha-glucosidase (family GH31 glycosyl hydrolase)
LSINSTTPMPNIFKKRFTRPGIKIYSFLFYVLLLNSFVLNAQVKPQLQADKKAITEVDNARFTVLTPQLIRLEWDDAKTFDDHASFVVMNRNLPVPPYTTEKKEGWFYIRTAEVELAYKLNSGTFTKDNLKIRHLSTATDWFPGKKQKNNLKGTTRTLDNYDGDTNRHSGEKIALEDGVLSRDGWFFLDDSSNLRLDNSDWPWVYETNRKGLDWYFMAYGDDYKSALKDYSKIAGKVPMLPRYAFGYWWSRYWSYSDNELRTLASNFKRYNIPVDVLVVDMDWHKEGWTGWTWNKRLFPNPEGFLNWTNDSHLKTTLNLHPADGVGGHEDIYNKFASEVKFDTLGRKPIPFVASDKQYMTTLFNTALRPMEKMGVDFWWLDWQQWPNDRKITTLSNTWWLNYIFYTEMERSRQTRPMLYHRWGGLGNHRYQIGFSGDSFISWASLEYQPYFTNTASNVLYSYWSHDVGGHQLIPGEKTTDPELYTRWLQYGALSPILRTHSTKNGYIKKELWNFSNTFSQAQYEAIRLRYTLVPYIYTMAKKTYDTSIGLCRPMYYDYPKDEEAYKFSKEYMFGDNMLVAPIGTPAVDGLSAVKVWLPKGTDWYEWHTGTLLKGGQIVERKFAINEYPIYVKAGSIIPMYNDEVQHLDENPEAITFAVYPGANGEFNLYEDNGNDQLYDKQHAITTVKSTMQGRALSIVVSGAEGSYSGMPKKRDYIVKVYSSEMPQRIEVNGKAIGFSKDLKASGWNYTGKEFCLNIALPESKSNKSHKIVITYSNTQHVDVTNGLSEKFKKLTQIAAELKSLDNGIYIPEALGRAEETNRALEYYPEQFYQLIEQFNNDYSKIPETIKSLKNIKEDDKKRFIKLLQEK